MVRGSLPSGFWGWLDNAPAHPIRNLVNPRVVGCAEAGSERPLSAWLNGNSGASAHHPTTERPSRVGAEESEVNGQTKPG